MNNPTESTSAANAAVSPITEADIVGWLHEQSVRYAVEFPLLRSFEFKANNLGNFFAAGWDGPDYHVGVGKTPEEAVKDLRKAVPAPAELAAKKRQKAAQLIAEADQLSAKAA